MRAMKEYERCSLLWMERINCSVYGNPRYKVAFEDSSGKVRYAKTASDASCGYSVDNYRYHTSRWEELGRPIYLKYHFTKNGNCVIDYIKHNTSDAALAEAEKEAV